MKKVLLLTVFCLMAAAGATAQNANRGGFFIEAAIGGATGSTPRTSFDAADGNLNIYHAAGTSLNVALGIRQRISSYAAYELVLEVQSPLDAIRTQPVAKLMPLSFRFTTPEFWRNYSVYIDLRVGGAVGNRGELEYWDDYHYAYNEADLLVEGSDERHDFTIGDGGWTGGVAYHLGVGVNLSNHFYAGFSWDSQYMFNQYRDVKKENLNWGMAGLRLGYRF